MRRLLSAAAVLALLALAPASLADPTGQTTLDETVAPGTGHRLRAARRGARASRTSCAAAAARRPRRKRAQRRRSLAFFAQLTDPQIADEMSPARVDFVDPRRRRAEVVATGRRRRSALQTFDAIVRNVNANRRSTVSDGARQARASCGFALTTGDLADNQQLNETRWFRDRARRRARRPVLGQAGRRGEPVRGASPRRDRAARRRRRRAPLHRRCRTTTTGAARRADLYGGYWDPDEAAPAGGPYAAFPRYPGLMDARPGAVRRRRASTCRGTSRAATTTAWSRATRPASTDLFRAIAVGCLKVFPTPQVDPARSPAQDEGAVFRALQRPGVHRVAARRRPAACRRIRTAGSSPRPSTAR